MSEFVNDLYDKLNARRSSGYKFYGWLYPEMTRKNYYVPSLTKNDLQTIEDTANYFGFKPVWLANLINLESGGTFNPAVQNNYGATGLIQFYPNVGDISVGSTTTALRNMTFKQQMVYVKKYFYNGLLYNKLITKDNTKVKDSFTFLDLCMIVFYPKAIGKPNYIMPASVVAANPSVKTAQDYVDAVFKNKLLEDIYDIATAPISIVSNIIKSDFVKKNFMLLAGALMFLIAGIGGIIILSVKKKG